MRISIWLFICSISHYGVHAQDLESTFELAKEFHLEGNSQGAAPLLERVAFFDSTGTYKYQCYVMLVRDGRTTQSVRSVLNFYDLAINSAPSTTIANDLVLEKAAFLIEHRKFYLALQELYSQSPENTTQQEKTSYLMGIAHFGVGDYPSAAQQFSSLTKDDDSLALTQLFTTIEKKLNPKRARVARTMSYVVPGSGQLYAGSVKGSINSIVLLSGITALYLYVVKEYGIGSGLITVIPWFTRYYIGGTENAFDSMSKRQEKLKDRYFKEVLQKIHLN